jgi:ketosteroid isomerase-like protein
MTPPTIDLARRALSLLSDGEFEELIGMTDPEVKWHSFFAELGKGGVYTGHEGMREYARDLKDAWDLVRVELDDALEVGDVALLVGRIHYRGKTSGVETKDPAGWSLTFQNGKVVEFRAFRDPERALRDIGASD